MYSIVNHNDFDFNKFMKEHQNDLVVVVSGSCLYDTHTGSYFYQTRYNGKKTLTRTKSFSELRSPNRAMLEAVFDACQRIQMQHKEIFILSSTPLGFKTGAKLKGSNADLISKIFKVCIEKNLKFNSVAIDGGSFLIKGILANIL